MATCADCVHVGVCKEYVMGLAAVRGVDLNMDELKTVLQCDGCEHFADRSRFVELPCKVGDILYHPVPLRNVISEFKIKSFQIYPNCVWVNWNIVDEIATINLTGIYANEIGETVFLTREEAEQALKEREHNA